MNNLPYYPMYPKDFDADINVRVMTRAQRGMYLDLLNMAWVNDGLPSDPVLLRAALRDDPMDFERDWPSVQACFPVGDDGKRRNQRQEEERSKALSKSAKASASAKRSHSVRTAFAQPTPSEGTARASDSVSDSDSEYVFKDQKEVPQTEIEFSVAPMIAELTEIYRKAGAPIPEKHQQIATQLLISIPAEKRARVPAYCQWALWSGKWPEPAKTKALINVLRDGDWDVDLVPRTLPTARAPSSGGDSDNSLRRYRERKKAAQQ